MILNLLMGLMATSAIQAAFARTWFLSEIDLRKRAQTISKIRFERTKFLIGIDPESCKKEESVDRKEQLVMKQLEEVRKRGHLSHCSHLKFPGQEALESSLAQTPLPGRIRMPETDVPKPKPIPIGAIITPGNTPPTQVPGEPVTGGGAAPTSPSTPTSPTKPPAASVGSEDCHRKVAESAARTGRGKRHDCFGPGTDYHGTLWVNAGSYPYMKGSEYMGTGVDADRYIAVAQTGEDLKLTYLHRAVAPGTDIEFGNFNALDDNFRYRSPTHFNGHEMKSEGMHALRLFYSGEAKESAAYLNPQECRVIISGEIEYTGALHATPTHPCMSLCQKKLKELVTEKKPKGFFMSCHLLGETIGTDSRGDAASQGIYPQEPEKYNCSVAEGLLSKAWIQSTNSYHIDNQKTVYEKKVSYKAECYREFVDYYYERSKKNPLIGATTDDPNMLVLFIEEAGKKEKLGEFKIRMPLEEVTSKTEACEFDIKVLDKNFVYSSRAFFVSVTMSHYLTWVAKDLNGKSCKESCDKVTGPSGPLPNGIPKSNNFKDHYADWSFTCADKSGIYKKCTMKGGCK